MEGRELVLSLPRSHVLSTGLGTAFDTLIYDGGLGWQGIRGSRNPCSTSEIHHCLPCTSLQDSPSSACMFGGFICRILYLGVCPFLILKNYRTKVQKSSRTFAPSVSSAWGAFPRSSRGNYSNFRFSHRYLSSVGSHPHPLRFTLGSAQAGACVTLKSGGLNSPWYKPCTNGRKEQVDRSFLLHLPPH